MIFLSLFRVIFGYIRFKIMSDYPEKTINAIKNAGLTIWNIKKMNDDILDLPSLETVSLGGWSFYRCHIAVFESMR